MSKRQIKMRQPSPSPIRYSEEARGLSGTSALSRRQQAQEADIRSIALAQPHRRGDDSREIESALGRLCKANRWHSTCYDAGLMYGEHVRQLRLAEGFHVAGGGQWSYEEEEDPKIRLERYRLKVEDANCELRSIKLRLPNIMVSLCYDDREQSSLELGIIGGGLVKLALHYGLRKFYHEPQYAGDSI